MAVVLDALISVILAVFLARYIPFVPTWVADLTLVCVLFLLSLVVLFA